MSKLHIKKGDLVYVNAGKDKGKEGIVLKVLVDKQRAIVEGCNMITKHAKPSANNPQGGREQVEAAIHISNLNPINPDTKKPAKVGRKVDEKTGKLVRFFKTKKENK